MVLGTADLNFDSNQSMCWPPGDLADAQTGGLMLSPGQNRTAVLQAVAMAEELKQVAVRRAGRHGHDNVNAPSAVRAWLHAWVITG